MALQVVDALAGLQQVVRRHRDADDGRVLGPVVVHPLGEGRELADIEGVGDGVQVLEELRQPALPLPGQGAGPLRDAHDLAGRRVAAEVAGAAVAGGVADAHALHAARVVGRDGLALHGHGDVRVAEALGGPGRALGQGVPQALPLSDLMRQIDHLVGVAPGDPLLDQLLFAGLHRHRQHIAVLDGVNPVVVAEVDDESNGVTVVVAAVGAQGPRRLVLEALHVDGVLAVGLHLLLAGHRAGVAGGVVDEDGLLDLLPRYLAGGGEAGELGIASGQGPQDVGKVHQAVGAQHGEAPFAGRGRLRLVHDGGQGR